MWSIVPFKILTQGKQRLAGVLTERERIGLSRAMVEDLLSALQQVQLLEGILMVSDDEDAFRLAGKYRLELIKEDWSRGSGLNNAINRAIECLMSKSIDDIMVIHGDLPLVSQADITNLILQHRSWGKPLITLVPDRWGTGTNCLLGSSCKDIPVCFGKDSLTKHREAAEQLGIPCRITEVPSIMFDIDTPDDLRELIRRLDAGDKGLGDHTRALLHAIDRERFREMSSAITDGRHAVPEHEVMQ